MFIGSNTDLRGAVNTQVTMQNVKFLKKVYMSLQHKPTNLPITLNLTLCFVTWVWMAPLKDNILNLYCVI